MKRSVVITAAAALAAVLSSGAPALAGTSGHHVFSGEEIQGQNVQDGLWLHQHSLSNPVQDAATAANWTIDDSQAWGSNHNGTVTTIEIRLSGTNDCWTDDTGTGYVDLQACASGFGNGTQDWYVPVDPSTGKDWWINAYASAHSPNPPHDYIFATDNNTSDHFLVLEGPGNGNYAEWADTQIN